MMLKLEFEDSIWSKVIDVLADRPFKETGAIINSMAQQFNEQRQREQAAARNGGVEIDGPRPS